MTPLEAAHDYARMGWRVIPIVPGKKMPSVERWVEVATSDHDKIEDWWGHHQSFGVGVVTGYLDALRRRCLFVLDVDEHDPAKSGGETLADLEATYGPLPETVECHTGSGGRHLYFLTRTEIRNDAGKRLGPGLDIRGVGGQVLAPPTIHPNGRQYVWELEHGPEDVRVAQAPTWLVSLLTALPSEPTLAIRAPYTGSSRPGDRFAASVMWPEMLARDGATFLGSRRHSNGSYEMWARPGTDHASATLYYGGTDLLKVFSSNWPGLSEGETYTRFGYFVATRYGGDFAKAARELGARQQEAEIAQWVAEVPKMIEEPTLEDPAIASWAVDWGTAWATDFDGSDWILEPLVARGRGHALYAPAKTGKSLITLEAAAALATGRAFLDWPGGTRHHVIYVDYEMTLADLMERLAGFGYGPEDDLSHLHYILLPTIPSLDTIDGATFVVEAAIAWGCEWAIIDTMGRAISGIENDSTAYMAFARITGLALKSAGIAYHRLDHAGKSLEAGQRGSSAKNDDVDVVQRLTRLDGGALRLEATHRRMAWVPERVDLALIEDELTGTASHMISRELLAPEGVSRIVAVLDRLEVPLGASRAVTRKALKDAGERCQNSTLSKVLKTRNAMKGQSAPYSEEMLREAFGTVADQNPKDAGPDTNGPLRTRRTGIEDPRSPHEAKTHADHGPGVRTEPPEPRPRRDLY